MARLWAVVRTANVLGAVFAAAFLAFADALAPEVRGAVGDLSRHATGKGRATPLCGLFPLAFPSGLSSG